LPQLDANLLVLQRRRRVKACGVPRRKIAGHQCHRDQSNGSGRERHRIARTYPQQQPTKKSRDRDCADNPEMALFSECMLSCALKVLDTGRHYQRGDFTCTCRIVLVEKTDRLYRNRTDALAFEALIERREVEIQCEMK
jgi:hypothetical protein